MTEQVIIAGFGGQGVISTGMTLAHAGMNEGKEVSWFPSYGAEMRGGTANCCVVVSDEKVASPIVNFADTVIVMNKPSLIKFESRVRPGGKLFINSSLIDQKASRDDIEVYYVPVNEIAAKLGNTRVIGMVMMGAYLKVTDLVKPETMVKSLGYVLGEKKKGLIPINEKALAEGGKVEL